MKGQRQRQRQQGLHSKTDTKYPKKLEGLIDWQLRLTNFPPLSYLKKLKQEFQFLEKYSYLVIENTYWVMLLFEILLLKNI